jgi:hypothetical protein
MFFLYNKILHSKEATTSKIFQHQLEGGSNPLVYRLQPKGSYNSLYSRLQPEGGYNPLSLPLPSTLKYVYKRINLSNHNHQTEYNNCIKTCAKIFKNTPQIMYQNLQYQSSSRDKNMATSGASRDEARTTL